MEDLVDIFKKILASSYTLYLKTQNYHWNVTSRHSFRSLHKLFEKQYEDLADAVDEIAEKIRQIGSKAPASFKDYLDLTKIREEDSMDVSADDMITKLADDQSIMMDLLNKGIKISYDAGDEGAADLLIDRLRVHDKNRWMLKSSL